MWVQSQGAVLTVRKFMPKTDELHIENIVLERLGASHVVSDLELTSTVIFDNER